MLVIGNTQRKQNLGREYEKQHIPLSENLQKYPYKKAETLYLGLLFCCCF